jgi:hypothetical protein
VKLQYEKTIAYDETEHKDIQDDMVFFNGAGQKIKVKVPMEYRCNLYELCMPLVTIFKEAYKWVNEKRPQWLGKRAGTSK